MTREICIGGVGDEETDMKCLTDEDDVIESRSDPDGVGKNRIDSFGILQLNNAATEREIKVQYRRLARIYHPDKYDSSTNPT